MQIEPWRERERYLTENIGFYGFYFVRAKSIAFSIPTFQTKFEVYKTKII